MSCRVGTLAVLLLSACGMTRKARDSEVDAAPPHIILMMADDLGWGDTGYQGHPQLRTPHLDAMAANGLRFDRWYANSPVCSPTRGGCLTGRHPYRYGIRGANSGHLPLAEINLASWLQQRGYRTGHFGKWHLGTLTTTLEESNRGGPRGAAHYAPPWERGFDTCFSTEAKVPTYDPMITPTKLSGGTGGKQQGTPYGTHYWIGPERRVLDGLEGDDSELIMDRALTFIDAAVRERRPFFTVIWFHAPHLPIVAGPQDLALYAAIEDEATRHYYGCITALDRQVGRLRARLRELGVAENTMLWFCSDNGPEGAADSAPGSAGDLRGRKRSLFEGGVRVPGLLEWPRRIPAARRTAHAGSTLDYFPTVAAAVDPDWPRSDHHLDGINLLPVLDGPIEERQAPLGFESGNQRVWMESRYKLVLRGEGTMLFDLIDDPGEARDLAAGMPERVDRMRRELESWRASCSADRERSQARSRANLEP